MKYLILTAFLFSLSISSFGQGFKLVGLNENFERVDSVIFGFADNATLGVDAQLGEANIFNRPTPAYDMRVVQRDSTNFSCSTTFVYDIHGDVVDTAKHYFPTNFDSKINYRSKRDTSFLNRLFEIKFPSLNIKRFYFSFLSQNQIFSPVSQNQTSNSIGRNAFRVSLDSCLSKKLGVIVWVYDPLRLQDPFIWLVNSPMSNLVFLFEPGFILDSKEATDTKIRVYPNPFSDILTVDNIESGKVKEARLFDILGREVLRQKIENSESLQLNVSHLSRGTYQLTLFGNNAQPVLSKTVVK